MELPTGIEPVSQPYQGRIIPLYYESKAKSTKYKYTMKVLEVIKHSYHKVNSDASAFRKNMGVRDLTTYYKPGEDTQAKNKLVQVIGHGAYSTAVQTQRDPNNVLKISRGTSDLNEDPYYLYLSRIASSERAVTNPFIPRVYQVKVYETTDKVHPYFYIVKMEKLEKLETLSSVELIEMITTLTKARMTNRFKMMVGTYNAPEALKAYSHDQLIVMLVDKVRREKIKNPELQAAMDLAASTGMDFDITRHNIMVRPTPTGPQLVLADPVKN